MKVSRGQQRAVKQLLTARSWPQRIGAAVVLAVAAVTWWQQSQVKPGQMVKGGSLLGRVVAVADGDTITMRDAESRQYKLRLAYIDAPEKAMPFGQEAKRSLVQLVDGKQVEARIDDVDNYGRGVARIAIDGLDVNYAQVSKGYAWHYTQYASKSQAGGEYARYQAAQAAARGKHSGLWRDTNPTPPWQWRNAQRR
jgi:endonuclease YncB( thermonuclease family)